MTTQARRVLSDCEESLIELMKSEPDTLRRRWVATVSLLRAVGHALDKVDGEASPTNRTVIDDMWPLLKRADIFAGFIDDERNNVLKEYRFAVRGDVTIGPFGGVDRSLRAAAPGLPVGSVGITDQYGTQFLTSSFKIRPLDHGPFAGRDPVMVVREAVAFWHSYLDDVDRRIAARKRK